MKEIIDKLTTYNIFNCLFPGVVFVVFFEAVTDSSLIQENVLIGAFLYYFIGLVISRVGSLVLAPLLRKMSVIKFADYKSYVEACKSDERIELFSEVNNTYRTLSSLFLLLIFYKVLEAIMSHFELSGDVKIVALIVLLFILFLFSYRKQTEFIRKRVELVKESKD